METEKKDKGAGKAGAEQNKSKENKSQTESKYDSLFETLAGIDFNKLNIPPWVLHLLTGIGAMSGNYFMWIKPMQDKMEAMNKELTEQESRIRDLEFELDKVIQLLNREYDENGEKKEEFLLVNRRGKLDKSTGRRFTKM